MICITSHANTTALLGRHPFETMNPTLYRRTLFWHLSPTMEAMSRPSDKDLIRRAEMFVKGANTLASLDPPNSPPSWADAMLGTELSLKAVLAKNGVSYEKIHKLEDLTLQVQNSGILSSSDMSAVTAGVTAVTMSGSYNFARYPEKDPIFFESLSPGDLQNRIQGAKNVFEICAWYVGYTSGVASH